MSPLEWNSGVTTIAVTGATGFIGRQLVTSGTNAGLRMIGLGRRELEGDVDRQLRGCDALVHLAARAHVLEAAAAGDAAEFDRVNVDLTRRVAHAARASGVRRLVHVSSAGVLGRVSPPEGFNDWSQASPHDAYTHSKLAAEEALRREFDRDLELVIVRPPLVYGPGAPGNFARLVSVVQSGWPLPFGGLSAPRSMIGLRNLCDFLRLVAVHPAAQGPSLLVADAETPSVAELMTELALALGRPARLFSVPLSVLQAAFGAIGRGAELERLAAPFVLRPGLALERLGWNPPYAFRQEISWAVTELARAGQ